VFRLQGEALTKNVIVVELSIYFIYNICMGIEKLGPSPEEYLSDSDLEKLRDGSEEAESEDESSQEEDPLIQPRPSEYLSKEGIGAMQGVEQEEVVSQAGQETIEGIEQVQSTKIEKEEDSSDETLE